MKKLWRALDLSEEVVASRKLSTILNRGQKQRKGHMSMGGSRRVSGIVCFCT